MQSAKTWRRFSVLCRQLKRFSRIQREMNPRSASIWSALCPLRGVALRLAMVVQPVRIRTAERASTAFVIGSERSTRRRTSDDSENGRARRGEALGQLRIHHDLADELLKREIQKRLVAADV